MAKETPAIGLIDASTPAGSILTMEKGKDGVAEQYKLNHHDDDGGFELGGVGEATELASFYFYEDWNDEYAPFVTEIKYPEAAVDETPEEAMPDPEGVTDMPEPELGIGDCAVIPHGEMLDCTRPISVPASTMGAVEEARDRHRESESVYERLADQAKAAKKNMEHDQEDLNAAIDSMIDGELIREDGWPKDVPLAGVADDVPARGNWKNVELADLNDPHIKVGILTVLAENGIHTMGQLAEWQAAKGDFWATDLKGVGKAACDSISDATDAYWTHNPQPVEDEPFAPAAETTPTDGDTEQ